MSNIDIFEDAQGMTASDEEVRGIGETIQRLEDLEAEKEALSINLKELSENIRKITEQVLPELMDGANCGEFKTTAGAVYGIKDIIQASISKANEVEAFEWLRKEDHEDLIKRELKLKFSKGQDNVAKEVCQVLIRDFDLSPEDKQTVHPGTLSAFVREQMGTGASLPMDLLGVFTGRKAYVKK